MRIIRDYAAIPGIRGGEINFKRIDNSSFAADVSSSEMASSRWRSGHKPSNASESLSIPIRTCAAFRVATQAVSDPHRLL